MKRIIPLSVLSVVAGGGFLFGIACRAPDFDEKMSSVNAPCASDDQCPIYLGCHAGVCTPRCGGEGYCDSVVGGGYGTCQGGLCLATPTGGTSGGASSSSGSSGAASCVLGGESVRAGVPAIGTSSAAAVAVDDAHLYVSMQGTDSLGRAQSTVDAYPFDGGAAQNLLTTSNAMYAPPTIFRSGSWLYLTVPTPSTSPSATTLSRIPVSAADGAGATPELTNIPTSVAAYAPSAFYVGDYQGAYVRVDGETAVADSTILGFGSAISLTADKAFYRAVSQPSYGDDGGTTTPSGPATGEIAFGSLAGGDTFRTGIILPDYATTFQVAGTTAFFLSPNGTLLSLDLTLASATPHTVHGPGLGNLSTDGKALFTVSNPTSGDCAQLQRIDPSTGATTTLANVSTAYSGYYSTAVLGFYGGYYYWIAGAELRRVKIAD